MKSCGMTKTDRGQACLLDDPHRVETSEEEEQQVQEEGGKLFFPQYFIKYYITRYFKQISFFMMSHFRKFNKM